MEAPTQPFPAEAERLLTQAYEALSAPVCITDETGRVLFANQAYRELQARIHPDENRGPEFDLLLGGARNPLGRVVRRAGGGLMHLALWPTPLRLSDGRQFTVTHVRDITEFVSSRRLVDRLFESSHDLLTIIDGAAVPRRLNQAFERILGYAMAELRSRRLLEFVHPEDREKTQEEFQKALAGGRVKGVVNRLVAKDGQVRWLEWNAVGLPGEDLVYAIGRDITERVQAENALRASLREKEILLKEIHHRVKNNLQVASSLLDLQASAAQDAGARAVLEDSQRRIRAMAFIHENLYESRGQVRVDIRGYLENLTQRLMVSLPARPGAVRLETDVAEVPLDLDTCVLCGLIVNELVSNALKHAFPAGTGSLQVSLKELGEGTLSLSVADDGVGMPEPAGAGTPPSLGIQLVGMLAAQLHGSVSVERTRGTRFAVQFPRPAGGEGK